MKANFYLISKAKEIYSSSLLPTNINKWHKSKLSFLVRATIRKVWAADDIKWFIIRLRYATSRCIPCDLEVMAAQALSVVAVVVVMAFTL